jgi:23S rRNA (guanosine2251-2'-O)-methyltransferase
MRKPHNDKRGKRPGKSWDKNRDKDQPRGKHDRDRDHAKQRDKREKQEARAEQEHAPRPHGHQGGKPMLYGFHAVRAAWLNPERYMQALYLTEQSAKNFEETLAQAKKKSIRRPPPQIVDKAQIDRMLPRDAVHQGIALLADELQEVGVQDMIIKAKEQDRTTLLMLDQVTDPHNVGAILRSACAFGAEGMILQRRHAPELNNGVLAKTACGAVEFTPVAYETNLSRAIEELKEGGFFVIGLDERGAQTINEYVASAKPGNVVLVLGAEGEGMRRLVAENCDLLLRLPTQGKIQSLNVSNAAAVALYSLAEKS